MRLADQICQRAREKVGLVRVIIRLVRSVWCYAVHLRRLRHFWHHDIAFFFLVLMTISIKTCTVFSLVFCLFGCATADRKLETLDCGPWLFGIANASAFDTQFAPLAALDNQRAACLPTPYSNKLDAAALPSLMNSTAANQQTVFSHYGEKITVQFSGFSNWEQTESPSPLYQIFSVDRQKRAAMFVSVYDANPFFIWSDTRDSMYQRIRMELESSEMSLVKEFTLNGLKAFQVEYQGRDKHGVALHFLTTQIRVKRKLVYLTTWSFADDYAKNQREFHQIANSLIVKPRGFSWLYANE